MATLKLVSMKRSAKDKREDKLQTSPAEAMAPDFPWGLCIHLDKDEIEKLGIKDLPEIGAEVQIQAKAKVTRVSQSASDGYRGGEDQLSIDLQITDIAIA